MPRLGCELFGGGHGLSRYGSSRQPRGRLNDVAASLAHVLIVAGTRREWAAMSAPDWQALADELGAVVAAVGCAWLTLRAYEDGGRTADGRRLGWPASTWSRRTGSAR